MSRLTASGSKPGSSTTGMPKMTLRIKMDKPLT